MRTGLDSPFPRRTCRHEPADRRVHHPHRDRRHGPHRGASRPLLGGPDRAVAAPLSVRGPNATGHRACLRPAQGRLCGGQCGHGPAAGGTARPDRGRCQGGEFRPSRRRVSAQRLADRQRHAEQHERERGHQQPRHRDGGGAARLEEARAPERSREHVAEQQRHLSHGHARGCGDRARAFAAAGGAATSRRAARQGTGLRHGGEDRSHPPAGRRAAHAGPGLQRLRGSAGSGPAGDPREPAGRA
jgi:hypothetical protein